jgi:hypothetical protein
MTLEVLSAVQAMSVSASITHSILHPALCVGSKSCTAQQRQLLSTFKGEVVREILAFVSESDSDSSDRLRSDWSLNARCCGARVRCT